MIKKLLNMIFGQNKGSMNKLDYWRKYRFFELIKLFEKAHQILIRQETGASDNFSNPQEFAEAVDYERDSIEFGNQTDLTRLYKWFAPTCDWDDIVHSTDSQIASKIFEICKYWYKKEAIGST